MKYSYDKIITLSELHKALTRWRLLDRKVVFTNGCFDLLHAGHIEYLEQCRYKGDRLIIGVNDDDSVRRLKGDKRPIQDVQTRTRLLAALEFVDVVIVFSEDTPIKLIKEIRPDILMKGGDYKIEDIVGGEFVASYGGKVETAVLTEGESTTELINRITQLMQ